MSQPPGRPNVEDRFFLWHVYVHTRLCHGAESRPCSPIGSKAREAMLKVDHLAGIAQVALSMKDPNYREHLVFPLAQSYQFEDNIHEVQGNFTRRRGLLTE
jgi:hypothetical protein